MITDVVELTSQLVKIPSVNPMGRKVGGTEYGEGRLAKTLQRHLYGLGAEVDLQWPLDGRPNVLARFAGSSEKAIVFEAHMDTVPVDNMVITPFSGDVVAGKVMGRGTADEKGPMAAMLCAIERAIAEGLRHTVIFAAVCDEEYQFHGVHALLKHRWLQPENVRFAVVAEPTMMIPVMAHKGVVRWEIASHGKAAHSSTPQLGENAIYRMAGVIGDLDQFATALDGRAPHPLLGKPTLSVGTIRGGAAVNVVPDECVIQVDRRLIPGESPASATEEIQGIARRHGVTVSEPIVQAPAFEVALSSDVVGVCRKAGEAVGQMSPPVAVNYCTDATFYPLAGIDAVVFGPGDISQAHTADEWISVEQLRKGVDAYFSVLHQ